MTGSPYMRTTSYLLQRAAVNLRTRGLRDTFLITRSMLSGWMFDWRYGTDTGGHIEQRKLRVASANQQHAKVYLPSKAGPTSNLLRQLALPKSATFVDFGAGKGRVLLLAAQYGFARVVGVEFAADLCRIARANVVTFLQRTGLTTPIEIVDGDATHLPITSDQRVFFFFNPFAEPVMRTVMQNIEGSLTQFPRRAWVIYNTPAYEHIINRRLFPDRQHLSIQGTRFSVFAH
jgi:SAM-dependent methyltransferase